MLVDTFVVRTLVVPALFAIVGERMWWPGRSGGADPAPIGVQIDRTGENTRMPQSPPPPSRAEPMRTEPTRTGRAGRDERADGFRTPRTWASLVGSIRIGQAVITVVLLVIGAWRAAVDGVPLPWVLALSLVFLGWYGGGLLLSERTSDRRLATWWLLGLTLIWLGAVVVSPESCGSPSPLWLLAGFVMRLRWALLAERGDPRGRGDRPAAAHRHHDLRERDRAPRGAASSRWGSRAGTSSSSATDGSAVD